MSVPRLTNLTLQDRDVSLLVDLLESRVLSLDHVRALHFSGKDEMAKKRVQRLKSVGYLAERPRRIGEPSILLLTWKGYTALRTGGHVGEDSDLSPKTFARRMGVSAQRLAHELMVADVRTAFTVAMRGSERFDDLAFDVWPRRYEFSVNVGHGHVPMKPDGHVRFTESLDDGESEYHFFFEADTGSEKLDLVVEKCLNYREHYRTGGYAVFCGEKREDYKANPFRVLVVCQSEKRRNNLAEKLLETQPPFSTMILITTLAECVHGPLGEIWLTAAACKEAMADGAKMSQFASICA